MNLARRFLLQHQTLTRRHFMELGAAGAVFLGHSSFGRSEDSGSPELEKALAKLEPYFTPPRDFRDVSRGKPIPHSLPEDKKRAVGLTRETWKLEVIADPDHPATLGKQFASASGTALTFDELLKMGEKSAVRFPKVMTCLNIGCPLGMGIWEGVPLRELVWLTRPKENLRRVFYYGYHNDDPKQIFRSSLPIGRVLEDPFGLPPVILCYKLNGRWLDSKRGGPVRMLVPEAYGFKNVKWLTHLVLTNHPFANDTYADGNNDIDSPLKTFAATLLAPSEVKAGQRIALTGYAQVGISGLSKVQVWIQPEQENWPADDPYFTKAPWQDCQILPPPERWGGDFPEDKLPTKIMHFNGDTGRPRGWPMRLSKAHWAVLHPALAPGRYTLRCRSIDAQNQAQPMPRPFRKSGHAAIEEVHISVKA
jgi:DMSO/TMAO reductase YedYZ molybdopterin-dependent catalytic subunit